MLTPPPLRLAVLCGASVRYLLGRVSRVHAVGRWPCVRITVGPLLTGGAFLHSSCFEPRGTASKTKSNSVVVFCTIRDLTRERELDESADGCPWLRAGASSGQGTPSTPTSGSGSGSGSKWWVDGRAHPTAPRCLCRCRWAAAPATTATEEAAVDNRPPLL